MEYEDEPAALQAQLRSLDDDIPRARWASDIKHLKKNIATLEGGGDNGDGDFDGGGGGDESAATATVSNQDIQRLENDLKTASLL